MRRVCTRASALLAPAAAALRHASGSSEIQGKNDVPVLDQLVGYYINTQSRKMYYKDSVRAEHQAVRWAFADLRKNSEALATGLVQTGLRPGDKVLAIQPSNVETTVLQLACAKAGAMAVIVPHYNLTADKLRYYLNEFQPRMFLGREWLMVPEVKSGQIQERNMHFWDMIYNVIPELGNSYPGQNAVWVHSQEFYSLRKVIVSDHNLNLLGGIPLRKFLVWGPFSYYEQRLRRISALLHPEDPILALEDPNPASEDKRHIAFSHRNCNNAGFIFAQLLGLKAETRFGVLPNHHIDPIGAIVAPYAAITSGAVLVHLHDNLFTDNHAVEVIEKQCVEEVSGILGTRSDFDLILKHAPNFEADQYEHLKWVALFEDANSEPVTEEYMKLLQSSLGLEDVFVFSGPLETCRMLSYRTLKGGDMGAVPHVEAKVVGDRGTSDAKVLSRNNRGNLRLKGPHVSNYFVNNAGLLTEMVDEKGFTATSREALLSDAGVLNIQNEAQVY